jgi:two-component system, LytTR family, sensor kinase
MFYFCHMGNNALEVKHKQVINFLVKGRYRYARHGALLLGFAALIFMSGFPDHFAGVYRYYSLLLPYTVFILMFYINTYVLVPAFFFKARYILYLLLVILLVYTGLGAMGVILETYFEVHRIGSRVARYNRYEGIMISVPIILLTTTVKLLQRWTKDNERMAELSNITLNMELNELRNQINPHFLFNMLNNVKALIRNNPEKATTVIMKLSEFLRYQLYENTEEKTALAAELHFISNFLNLEKIRRDNLSLSIENNTDGRSAGAVFIPPNLFTTFVENAVKHSVDISGREAWIRISIAIEDKNLNFMCSNSKDALAPVATDKKSSGLGLANIKRRLELLYQDKHTLKIDATETTYTVNLIIPV